MHLVTFIVMSSRGNVHVCLGCTKTQNPGIGTVLHWRPPDVHIFHTDPSLMHTGQSWGSYIQLNSHQNMLADVVLTSAVSHQEIL